MLYLLISRGREIHHQTIPTYISYFVTGIAVKMSVFMNCVLGVVRCIKIVKPHYQINKKVLYVITIIYMLAWVLIVGLDLWQYTLKRDTKNQVHMVKELVMKPVPGFGLPLLTIQKEDPTPSFLVYHLGNMAQFILPTAFPTFLCFVLMIVQLYNMPKETRAKKGSKDKNRISKASWTIFLLTSIYVITSAVSIITWLIIDGQAGYLVSQTTKRREAMPWNVLIVIHFSLSTCPLLCSTQTPFTLLVRGTGVAFSSVRQFFSGTPSSILSIFKLSKSVPNADPTLLEIDNT
jgi:hypothetical protein